MSIVLSPELICFPLVQVYLTDLSTRESVLLCTNEHPILQLSLQDDTIWVATTDSSVYGWPAEGQTPQKVFQKGGSFLAGNLSFSRARASLEGSAPVSMTVAIFSSVTLLYQTRYVLASEQWCHISEMRHNKLITHYFRDMQSVMIVSSPIADK